MSAENAKPIMEKIHTLHFKGGFIMEENTVRVDEIKEPEVDNEVETEEEDSESSNGGAVVAGIVGGFLAYAAISGAKKLAAFIAGKLADRKQKKEQSTDDVVDAEFTEIPDGQEDSEEEASEEE